MKLVKFVFTLVFIVFIGCSSKSDEVSEAKEKIESQKEEVEVPEETIIGTVVEKHGQLSVEGNHMVDKDRNPVQLRGMSLFWSQWMGQYYTKETVKWLKEDWNVTIIRVAMGVEDDGGYLTNGASEKAKVFEVIDAAIEEGIYVLVDWHSHHAEDYVGEAKIFFAEVAEKYGEYPNLIYETYNEPLDVSWEGVLKPYHEEVVTEIRKYDPDNIVVCGTRNWSQGVSEVIGNKLNDPNIIYTLHYYASTHKEDLRNAAQTALDNDVPLFVTEYGVTEYTGDGAIDITSVEEWWTFLDANDISWCNWSVADKEENSAALKPGASGLGGWQESEITQSGQMVKDEMLEKNQSFK
ncbi:glycoside hydrolase family 5 protein [Zobellia uliginosa]|uniref:glycoside hydrolase family 5 protein n=1 Tax=Zobellia uliginosa TaxID=143224 RepID=UPI001C0729BE|nr:glycoside hydrolase family 5 protein [Zobellia uliginosa]MBU2945593.1 glycoside hydrolase family 5 protein [Zobellia uliginosa]